MMQHLETTANTPFIGYCNGDLLFASSFVRSLSFLLDKIRKNELLVAGGLDVEMKDFDFDVPDLKIVSFKVRLAQNGSLSSSMPSKGDKFSSEIVQMLQQSRRGNLVMFSDIVAQMPDGPRTLGDFTVSIE